MSDVGTAYVDVRADPAKLAGDLKRAKAQLTRWVRDVEKDLKLAISIKDTQIKNTNVQLQRTVDLIARINRNPINIKAKFDSGATAARLERLSALIDGLNSRIEFQVESNGTTAVISELKVIDELADKLENDIVAIVVDSTGVATVITDLSAIDVMADALEADVVNILVDVDGAPAAIAQLGALEAATDSLDNKNAERSKAGGLIGGIAAGVGLGAIAAATAALTSLATSGVSAAAALEMTEAAFTGMLGSQEEALSFIAELQDFAATTPFEFDQLTNSAQKMMGTFGVEFRSELIPTLSIIGDLTTALGQSPVAIDRVVLALTQMEGKGRLAGGELLQLREALPGFNPAKAIAEQLGITVAEATKRMQSGAIDAKTGIDLLLKGMAAFPGASGAMERASLTLNGKISTLKDNLKLAMIIGFEPLTDTVKVAVDAISSAIQPGGAAAEAMERLGQAFSDSLAPAIANIGPLVTALADFSVPFTVGMGEALNGILEAVTPLLRPLGELLGMVLSFIGQYASAVSPLTERLGNAASKLLSRLEPVFDALIEVVEELMPVWIELFDELIVALEPLVDPLVALAVEVIPLMAVGLTSTVKLMTELVPVVEFVVDVLLIAVDAMTLLADWAEKTVGFVSDIGTFLSGGETKGTVGTFVNNTEFGKPTGLGFDALDMIDEIVVPMQVEAKIVAEVDTWEATRELEEFLDPLRRAADFATVLNEQIEKLSNPQIDLTEAKIALDEFMRSGDGQPTGGGITIGTDESNANLQRLIDGGKAVRDAFSAAVSAGSTLEAATAEAQTAWEIMTANMASQFGISVDEVRAKTADLGLAPITWYVAIDAASEESVLAALDEIKLKVPPEIMTSIQTSIDAGDFATAQRKIDSLKETEIKLGVDADTTKIRESFDALERRKLIINASVSVGNKGTIGGFFRKEAGGTSLADIPSHYATGRENLYMYGEPSTGGEYFISMHPKFRDRNIRLLNEAAEQLGVAGVAAGPGHRMLDGAPKSGTTGNVVDGLDRVVTRLQRLERVMRDAAPIHVHTNSASPASVASKYRWAVVERRREMRV